MLRHLFLIAYDIRCARRRQRALKTLKRHAVGGQKSVYECWLTQGELQLTMASLRARIDPIADCVILLRLDPRATVLTLGQGVAPTDGGIFYLG